MKAMRKSLMCGMLLALVLVGCRSEAASIGVIGGADTQQGGSAASVSAVGPGAVPDAGSTASGGEGMVASVPRLVSTEEAGAQCETDSGLACPLAKPVEEMTKKYVRTTEQTARMETFDALTLEEKFMALQDGSVVCKEFVHEYAWEHVIDEKLIAVVGRDAYEKWLEMDDGCQSVYSFIVAFDWTKEEFEEKVRENGLRNVYDVGKMNFAGLWD